MERKAANGNEKGWKDRGILRISDGQHTIVRLDQLLSLGLTRNAVQGRVRSGRLHRRYPGVFAVGRPDVPLKGRWLAAVYACGDGALLANSSCLALRGLIKPFGSRIHVAIPSSSHRAHDGIVVHRSHCLDPVDADEVDGIPCTTLERALLDLAATGPQWLFERAVNQAEIEEKLDRDSIIRMLVRLRRHPGSRRLRTALGMEELGSDRTKSELERRFLRLCTKAGLPRPAVNEWMPIPGEEWQCDFVWHAEKLVVEVDGWETHKVKKAFKQDRRRDRVLQTHGWTTLRYTWDDLRFEPGKVGAEVAAFLAKAAA
jgi:predicted transcriptional regulator of viral defense system